MKNVGRGFKNWDSIKENGIPEDNGNVSIKDIQYEGFQCEARGHILLIQVFTIRPKLISRLFILTR